MLRIVSSLSRYDLGGALTRQRLSAAMISREASYWTIPLQTAMQGLPF